MTGHLDGHGVRHLLAGAPQRLLADELGDEHLQRLVALLALGEVDRARAAWRPPAGRSTSPRPSPRSAETGRTSRAAGERARLLEARAQPRPVHEVDLVQRDDGGQGGARRPPGRCSGRRRRSVSVAFRRTSAASTSDSASSTVVCMRRVSESNGFWKPGRSSSTTWQPSSVDHAGDAPARGLRVVADDAHLAADEGVDQRRLADVGPAEHGDEPGAEVGAHRPASPSPQANGAVSSSRRRTTRTSPPRRARRSPGRRTRPAPAGTARRAGSRAPSAGGDGDAAQLALAGGDQRGERGALRTQAGGVRRVLDVDAVMAAARRADDHGPHGEPRVRRVGVAGERRASWKSSRLGRRPAARLRAGTTAGR